MVMKAAIRKYRRISRDDVLMNSLSYFICSLAFFVTLYPFIFTLSASISAPEAVTAQKVFLWPVGFSLLAYNKIFESGIIWIYYGNTIYYTVVGTILSVFVTVITAYPLTRKRFPARNFWMRFITIPMFINGGLIPFYLVVVHTGLYNSRWAMIIPGLLSVYCVIVCCTFFKTIPEEVIESAVIDGCSHYKVLFKIILPLSKAVLAVLIISYGVGYWNSWFGAMLFLRDDNMQPLQIFLRRILVQLSPETLGKLIGISNQNYLLSFFQLKYAVIMVVIGPIILIYPLLQKYFVKGVMIGSLKG
jgi:putative aldouronate transport system permease protein